MRSGLPGAFTTRKTRILLSVAALFLALHIVNGIYFGGLLPNCARSYDEAMHSETLQFERPLSRHPFYAPGYELISTAIGRVAGRNWTAIYLTNNTFHLALLLVFCCLLGARARSPETGALAALLLCLYPAVAGAYNRYCLDFALMGVVTAAVYFLLKSDSLTRPGYTRAFFAAAVYGVLIKETFLAFVAGPFVYALFMNLRLTWLRDSRAALRLAGILAACAAVLGALIFFTGLRAPLWDWIFWEPSSLSWYAQENLAFFWKGLWESQLTPVFTAVLLAGIYFFSREAETDLKVSLALWILLPNLVLLFLPHRKVVRYLLPQLPALALISGFALRRLLDARAGRAVLSLLLAGGLAQLYALFYAPGAIAALSGKGFNYWKPEAYTQGERLDVESFRFKTELPVKIARALLADMAARSGKEDKKTCSVVFFPDDWSLEAYLVRSYFLLNSDREMLEARKGITVFARERPADEILHYVGYTALADIGYAVQLVPRGEPRPPLAANLPGWLRGSYEMVCWAWGLKPEPRDWDGLGRTWAGRLSDFREMERLSGGYYDAYILRAPPR